MIEIRTICITWDRLCPERDAICPHGTYCGYAKDKHSCRNGWSNEPELLPLNKPKTRRVKLRRAKQNEGE